MRYVCVFICFLLWLIFTLLLSFTVIGLVISVSDEWQETGITIEGAFNGCYDCVEIMADDDNGVPMMYYIGYEDIIGIELIKTE